MNSRPEFKIYDSKFHEWNFAEKDENLYKHFLLKSIEDESLKLCGFTGLWDVNNNKIYEGDILEYTLDDEPIPLTLYVEYCSQEAKYIVTDGKYYRNDLGSFNSIRKIVGNIYNK